ncbi:MAG: LPS assembly lipoprotein LptE [Prevotellaceae bacterium]|nr:LPS assembly lipoprotein LptE [Prevotellaceae bacterium]
MKKVLAEYLLISLLLLSACSVRYSFSGASIPIEANTFSVKLFQNMAPVVVPSLSSTFTEALKMKMLTGTRLNQTDEDNADLSFEGEITGYSIAPKAITADEVAKQNRLTITVRVKFENRVDPKQNYDKSFSQYDDYNSEVNFASVETGLIDNITQNLVEDIFNAAVANW